MTWYYWALIAIGLLLLVAYIDLFHLNRGIRAFDEDGDEIWIRLDSWVNYLTGTNGTSIRSTIHCEHGYRPRAQWLKHELEHIKRIKEWMRTKRAGAQRYVAKYLLSATFRNAEEAEAKKAERVPTTDHVTELAAQLQKAYDEKHDG